MAIKRMPIGLFMAQCEAALNRKDGYIMGATGQNPKNWAKNSWFFTQYKDRDEYTEAQERQALKWRETAARVWDCNGLPEGIYRDWAGVNINTRAKYNYSGWCGQKGTGMIPVSKRVPGAAVFWGKTAATITHVAYLYEPVKAGRADGDWYIIEARGVMYGVVKTKLSERQPNFWGIMDKYFDYDNTEYLSGVPELGEVVLVRGMEDRADVKKMQSHLIALGYDLGKYGADGDYGKDTETAVKAFQEYNGLSITGEYDKATHAALMKALEKPNVSGPEPTDNLTVKDGSWYVRTGPGKGYPIAGTAHGGDKLTEIGTDGWKSVLYNNEVRFISAKALKE